MADTFQLHLHNLHGHKYLAHTPFPPLIVPCNNLTNMYQYLLIGYFLSHWSLRCSNVTNSNLYMFIGDYFVIILVKNYSKIIYEINISFF